jgi:hypothetical protein
MIDVIERTACLSKISFSGAGMTTFYRAIFTGNKKSFALFLFSGKFVYWYL